MSAIVAVPLGPVPSEVWSALATALSAAFGCSCVIGSPMGIPAHAYDSGRSQYRADVVVGAIMPDSCRHVLAIADADVFVPGMNFVFGLADPPRRRAVLALPRLRPERYKAPPNGPLFLQRIVTEGIHERGHTWGLPHCRSRPCVMAISNSVADTGLKSCRYCDHCQRLLRAFAAGRGVSEWEPVIRSR